MSTKMLQEFTRSGAIADAHCLIRSVMTREVTARLEPHNASAVGHTRGVVLGLAQRMCDEGVAEHDVRELISIGEDLARISHARALIINTTTQDNIRRTLRNATWQQEEIRVRQDDLRILELTALAINGGAK